MQGKNSRCRVSRSVRNSIAAVTAAAMFASMAAAGQAAAAPQSGNAGDGTESVIVMLRDQLAQQPATRSAERRGAAAKAQNTILGKLLGPKPRDIKHFTLGNAFAATVTKQQAAALSANPAVASVTKDAKIAAPESGPDSAARQSGNAAKTPPARTQPGNQTCPKDPGKPLVEPEALGSINAATKPNSADQLASGNGVKVGFLADNMNPNYADFVRADGSKVFADYKDFSGSGPNTKEAGAEAYGDASSIAAQGRVVHDLSTVVNQKHPLPKGCNVVVRGVSPGASLVGLNVFGNGSTDSAILQAIDYAVTVDHVDVLNESLGSNPYPDAGTRNMVKVFNDNAVRAGVTVTASSGDAGITGTIGSPAADDPNVIAVGATTDNRLYAQTGYAAFGFSNGKWVNDNISALSSSGFTTNGRTIDLVAPGEGNWADCEPSYAECQNFQSPPKGADLQSFGGTSESAPLTAGVAALVIQSYRDTHGGASPNPAQVKRFITSSTKDLGLPSDEQGTGLLDARAAVEAARGDSSSLAVHTDQLDLQGKPGSTEQGTVTVTNNGSKPQTVALGTRDFAEQSGNTIQDTFDAKHGEPFANFDGSAWTAKKLRFDVPQGADRLMTQLAWQGGAHKVIRMSLLAPDGTFVANSRPQGGEQSADYANVDVRKPAAGKWTAVLYSAADGAGSYTGPVKLHTSTQRAVPHGQVTTPLLHLAPGQSAPVGVRMPIPADSGDTSAAVTIGSAGGHQTSVPVVLRSLVTDGFSGTITGGNARASSPGQTFSYGLDVPAGKRDLDVSLQLAKDPGDLVDGILVDPNGETAGVSSNNVPTGDGNYKQGKGMQLFHANPIPGRWKLIVVVQNPVSGKDISQRFTGTVGYDKLTAKADGLPGGTAELAPGKAATATVHVTNPGVAPIAVGLDARGNDTMTQQANPVAGQGEVDLPQPPEQGPGYLVPPDTRALTAVSSASVPAQLQVQNPTAGIEQFGDLDESKAGSTVSSTRIEESTGGLGLGTWPVSVQEIGPFGASGAPKGHASITASLETASFDRTVTSSTGDPFLPSVDPAAKKASPLVIQPGQTADIAVTITPGKAGSHVAGHLNLVTEPGVPAGSGGIPGESTGEVIATLPYSYTAG